MENEKKQVTDLSESTELNNRSVSLPESLVEEVPHGHDITVGEIDEILRATDVSGKDEGAKRPTEISMANANVPVAPDSEKTAEASDDSASISSEESALSDEPCDAEESKSADEEPTEPVRPVRTVYGNVFPDDAFAPTQDESETTVIDLLGDPVEPEEIEPEEETDTEPVEETLDEKEAPTPEPIVREPAPARAETQPKEEVYDPDKPRRVDVIFDFVELLIFTLVAVLCITSFVVKHAVVEGNSMYDTLSNGDVLIISDLFYTPRCGDIVVVEDYTTMLKKPIVKRVIAVGGQKVKITRSAVFINGSSIALNEPYVYTDYPDYDYIERFNYSISELTDLPEFTLTRDYFEFVVPEGELFVMGDHRNDSTDSRTIGTVREDAVLGKVLLRVFPFDKFGEIPNK